MSVLVFDREAMAKRNMGKAVTHELFMGDIKSNVAAVEPVTVPNSTPAIITVGSESYRDSEGYAKLWNEIEDGMKAVKKNSASFDAASYYALIDKLRIDVTRRRFDYQDLTGLIVSEVSNPRFSKSVALDEFLPYGAAFQSHNLAGESVSLIGQAFGQTGSVAMEGFAVGWADSLENRLYNLDIFSLQRVNDAVARGFVAKRNDLVAGQIVGKTFDASQKVAADTTGATAEDKLYITLNNAIEKLLGMKDPQTGQYIRADQMYMMVNPTDLRRISRVVNGQLNNKGAIVNREPLREITAVVPYYGDSIKVGKNAYTYNGVTAGKAYLYVPGTGYGLIKRGLTQQISQGSALNLATEEYAWYFVQSSYMAEFFGSSDSGVKAAAAAAYGSGDGFGFIVEITLP